MKLIASISAAGGWRAVYENMVSGKLETLPIAYWNQRADDEHKETITVAVVLLEDGLSLTEADDKRIEKKLIGYAAPGEMLTRWEKGFNERWAAEQKKRQELPAS